MIGRFLARSSLALTLAFSSIAVTSAAYAQRSVSIIRDAEIEALVRDYTTPILRAAGLSRSGIEIVIVNDRSFNAFVDGRRIFVNAGALMTSETPNEIIGVLAHETGHLAGGHQERLRGQLARAQTMAIVASLLGMGAVAAAAATNSDGLGKAGMGMAAGGPEMARRSILGYQRGEEVTADRMAVSYLEATGQSAQGMLKTFSRFQSALALAGTRVDPYQVSHPMPRERIANLETLAKKSPHFDRRDPPALQLRHDLMRAKIAVHMQGAQAAARMMRNPDPLVSQYMTALSAYTNGNPRDAVTRAQALAKKQPQNAYFHELLGDSYLKANMASEAANAYKKAMQLDKSNSGLIRVSYGRALLATGNPGNVKAATRILREGLDKDPGNITGYRFLAQAYGQMGEIGEAELATAEGHYHGGNLLEARIFAARAQTRLVKGSPSWIRAQDIINQKKRN
ncbi:M48 family metalloprotease [Limoniibacter endophyticus]|uniref:M48 family metalloprotease n=1 Tax=Limoniibacter endophyticus TaxID=1565040 RepID=UPI0036205FC7